MCDISDRDPNKMSRRIEAVVWAPKLLLLSSYHASFREFPLSETDKRSKPAPGRLARRRHFRSLSPRPRRTQKLENGRQLEGGNDQGAEQKVQPLLDRYGNNVECTDFDNRQQAQEVFALDQILFGDALDPDINGATCDEALKTPKLQWEGIIGICLGGELFGPADVAHGGFGVGVSKELLDDEEGGFVDGHVGTYGVADGMRGDGLGYARRVGVFLYYVAHGAGGEWFVASPFARGKEGFASIGVGREATSR